MRKFIIATLCALALSGASAQGYTLSQEAARDLATVLDGVIIPCGGVFTDFLGCVEVEWGDLSLVRSWMGLYVEDIGWEPVGPWESFEDGANERSYQTPQGRVRVLLAEYETLGVVWISVMHPVNLRGIEGSCRADPGQEGC